MFAALLLLLLAVPLAELWIILEVADRIGVIYTIVTLVGVSFAGAWLLKREGLRTWSRLRSTLGQGRVPSRELTDGALILVGGALLLTPGFLTDGVGLLLLLPPGRAVLKGVTRKLLARWVQRRRDGGVIVTHVTRVREDPGRATGDPDAARRPGPHRLERHPGPGEDDSRDTG